VIAIRGLDKEFKGRNGPIAVLRDLSLDIARGEIFGIIGRSGAGKSTLVRCINLLERPTRGQVMVGGRDMTALDGPALRAARHDIGMVFQHFSLLASRTVRDNIALPLELTGTPRADRRRRVEELLALVGLVDKGDAYPAQLSGGQKQRVGIARALASKPSVLLCDEATSALDPETTKSILALLKDINRALGLTIVLITHEMNVIKEIADRVAVLDGGRIVELGSVFDVFTSPTHPTARALVQEVLNQELPAALFDPLQPSGSGPMVFRIIFTGPSATDPIVSELVRRFGVSLNILHGRIDYIQGEPYGNLTVSGTGPEGALQAALDFLKDNNLKAEILGHVGSTDRAVA
jgi:D-methionine transport system ATP-binding protein